MATIAALRCTVLDTSGLCAEVFASRGAQDTELIDSALEEARTLAPSSHMADGSGYP